MEDLQTYLNLPDTHRLYSAGLALFAKYAMAQHSQHYAQLILGPFSGNPDTLHRCLKAVAATPPPPVAAPTVIRMEQPKRALSMAPQTSQEIDITLELRKLRHQRMQTSQKFHACPDGSEGNAARALICDRIDALSREIKRTEDQLLYLKKYGQLPPDDGAEDFGPMPTTMKEALAERARLSSHILKVEKRLIHLNTLRPTDKKREKIPDVEDKLRALVVRKSEVRMFITIQKNNEDATQGI